MEVILLEKVTNLGGLGDKVRVKSGYGRNFLIPYGKAVPATAGNVQQFEARRTELEQAASEKLNKARTRAEVIDGREITIVAKAGDEGKLFGSIGTRDIASAISELGADIEKSEVKLPGGALRSTGEFEIDVQLHTDIVAAVKLTVIAE